MNNHPLGIIVDSMSLGTGSVVRIGDRVWTDRHGYATVEGFFNRSNIYCLDLKFDIPFESGKMGELEDQISIHPSMFPLQVMTVDEKRMMDHFNKVVQDRLDTEIKRWRRLRDGDKYTWENNDRPDLVEKTAAGYSPADCYIDALQNARLDLTGSCLP